LATALSARGQRSDASEEAVRARREAEALNAPSIELLADAVCSTTALDRVERERAKASARDALLAYVAAAPPNRRDTLRRRPEIRALTGSLGGTPVNQNKP